MAIKLMYITNEPEIALIAEKAGVDRIFVDMEYIGKADRQGGLDTVQNHHSIDDVKRIRKVIRKAELLVRCNPIHDMTSEYDSSEEEIDRIVDCGADIIMLPYFKTVQEVERFLVAVNGRKKTMLLFETPESVELVDEILNIHGIDEVFIGLNDLSLGYHMKFMFELLAEGTVEKMCMIFRQKGIPYGFGGIAAIGTGMVPAELILKEHYRLGSTCVILSRSFCDCKKVMDMDSIKEKFQTGIRCIRTFEDEIKIHSDYFNDSHKRLENIIKRKNLENM